jgi:nucleotide-binding universal stress UspA family protein
MVHAMEAMMKTILLLVHDDAGQEARLQAALDVTRAVEGHLTCLDVSVMPVMVGDFYAGAGEAMLLADERAREGENRIAIEAHLAKESVPWDWIDTVGAIGPALEGASALADLIVVNRQLDDFPLPDMRTVAGDVVVRSGKPVLAVPADSRGFNLSGHALVCWDGSACATTAMRAAVPLLKLAESVTLFEVDEGGPRSGIEDAAEYLSRHDVHAVIRRRRPLTPKAAEFILNEIVQERADYVVMGGFSHLRFSEALFGGVTRTMLTKCPVPILMAH